MIRIENKLKHVWDTFIILLTTYSAVEIPARIVLGYPVEGWFKIFNITISMFFLMDVLFNFRSITMIDGKPNSNPKDVAVKYLRGWFTTDFLASIPFDLIIPGGIGINRIFRLLRLLRLLRLARLAQFLKKMGANISINPVIMRLVTLVFWICMLAHWIACGWVAFGGIDDKLAATMDRKYLLSLYWAITTLTTIGYGDISPAFDNTPLVIFAMIIEIMGAGIYGYVIGNVAILLANIDMAKATFSEKMDRINAFLKYRDIPAHLQERVRRYYDYIWESRLGYDESAVIQEFPPSLKTDISLYINREIIEKVPLFKGASEMLIRDIVLSLKPMVFIPGDFIIHRGEIGVNMFFISKGTVEVVSDDGSQVFATLTEGNFFGEIALLTMEPRTASIRAADYCDLFTLDKNTFEMVLERYPEFAEKMHDMAKKRQTDRTDTKQPPEDDDSDSSSSVLDRPIRPA